MYASQQETKSGIAGGWAMQEVPRHNNATLHYYIREGKSRHAGMTKVFESTALMFVDALLTITGHFSVSEGLENASESQVSPACCRKTFRQYKTYDKMNRISSSVAVVLLNKQ